VIEVLWDLDYSHTCHAIADPRTEQWLDVIIEELHLDETVRPGETLLNFQIS
jgi:hypothetical protein